MKISRCVFIVSLVATLGGCAALVTQPGSFTQYDLGTDNADGSAAPGIIPGVVEVRAPTWLSSSAMQYRLDFDEPASREVYAESRWAGHPSEMLQRLVGIRLAAGTADAGGCRLRVELDEFVQTFKSIEQSESELVARVALFAPRDELALARRTFVIRTAAPTPDAQGGVVAHRSGARVLSAEIAAWLDSLDGDPDRRLNVVERCGRG